MLATTVIFSLFDFIMHCNFNCHTGGTTHVYHRFMKRCGKCNETKPFTDFAKRYDWYESYCKPCQHLDYKQRYFYRTQVLKLPWKKYKRDYQERNRRVILNYLKSHPCIDCGEDDPVVLEFDHVRGVKRASLSLLVASCASIVSLLEEIEKCQIRCANCHRRKTFSQLKWRGRHSELSESAERNGDDENLALNFGPEYSCLVLRP